MLKRFFIILFFVFFSFSLFSQNSTHPKPPKKIFTGNFGYNNFTDTNKVTTAIETLPSDKLEINKNWWVLILFVIVFAFFVVIYYNYSIEINLIVKAIFNKTFFRQLTFNKNSVINSFIDILNVFFFFSVSTLILLFFDKNTDFLKSHFYTYIIILISVLFFYGLKYAFSKILAISLEQKIFSEYNILSIKISNAFTSLFLVFLIFISIYNPLVSEKILFLSFLIILLIFFLRVFKLLNEFFQQGFSIFYYILYLCTVEIFPVLIVLKLFSIQKL